MARRAAPYTVYPDPRTGLAWLNTSISGRRVRRSLGIAHDRRGQEHERRVAEAAAQAYAELITGRVLHPEPAARVQSNATLHELLSSFLVDDARTYPASAGLSVTHCAHFERFVNDAFRGFAGKDATPKWKGDRRTELERLISDEGPTDYVRERLRVVLKVTVTKEVSTLFRLFEWAEAHRHIASVPRRPKYPKKAIGVRSGPQRAAPVQATHEEMLRIIDALPEWAARGGRNYGKLSFCVIFVWDIVRFTYETGFRPSTVARLRVPEHFTPGDRRVFISPDIDKGRNAGRWVTLSVTAFEIIQRHAKQGVVFGKHDLRTHWKRAASTVLPPERAAAFSVYDFRHGAARHMVQVSGGNLLGVAHLLGHASLTTTNRYLAPAESHGDAVVAALDAAEAPRRRIPSAKPSARKKGPRAG